MSHGSPTARALTIDRKSTRLNSSHVSISYAVFCLKKKTDNFCDLAIIRHRLSVRAHDRDVRGASQHFVAQLIATSVGQSEGHDQRADAKGDTHNRDQSGNPRQPSPPS